MILDHEQVVSQLKCELEAVRGFERNITNLLSDMKRLDPFANLEEQAKGLRYNQQMAALYLERASAVLELINETRRGEVLSGDDLEQAIHAFTIDFPT